MMNAVWLFLVVAAVVAGAFSGRMAEVTTASVESAKAAVTLALGLVGVMAFWLGLMRVVQEGGLLWTLARGVRPVMVRLFPDVPAEHPAMSAMIMNIASNMLGLGNAATPFGIKAMVELNRLNPVPGVATNAMALFLAINTSSVALAPLGVIALRASIGSKDAAGIWLPTLAATAFSTAVAIASAKLLQRLYPPVAAYADRSVGSDGSDGLDGSDGSDRRGASDPSDPSVPSDPSAVAAAESAPALGRPRRAEPWRVAVAWAVVAAIVVALVLSLRATTATGAELGPALREAATNWLLPFLIAAMLLYGWSKGVAVYDAMIAGAREGFDVAVRIIPFLVAIIVAVGMFRASGMMDVLVAGAAPFTTAVGFPAEALPMAVLRALSGSGAYGIMAEIMQAHGPDSHVGYLVSVLQGSSETTFYVLAVYFGAVGVTRIRHALAAGLIADVVAVVASAVAVSWLLGPF